MVERALVEEIAGERVATPGIYLHQMPYPCYNHDKYVEHLRKCTITASYF